MPITQWRRGHRRRPKKIDSDSSSSSSRVDGGSPPPPGSSSTQPHKRRSRRAPYRRRRGADIDSSDGGSTNSGASPDKPSDTGPAYESRYHQIIASRIAELQLPHAADGSDFPGPPSLPSAQVLDALTRRSFHDNESRAALVEYQIQCFLKNDGQGRADDGGDSGESDPAAPVPEPLDNLITDEQYLKDIEQLKSRMTEIDTYTELDQEQANKLHLKYALYRIKAALLLKGKPVEELDDAVLELKYPPDLIVENKYFFHYVPDGYFGWYFDGQLCYKEFLTDYQRLVLLNDDGGSEYHSWSKYRAFYSTPEADREYLQFWENIVEKFKWLDRYLLIDDSSLEFLQKQSKAMRQTLRIAAGFPNMTPKLAAVGLREYIWNTRMYITFVKYLDGIFFEIWRRINEDHQLRFRDALKQVYDSKKFPAQDSCMEYELNYGKSQMEQLFRQCTRSISDSVPEYKARELIAQEICWTRGSSRTYEQYARKKLKIAELLGLVPKGKTSSVCFVAGRFSL